MAVTKIKRTLRPGPEKLASNVWHNIRSGRPQVKIHALQNTPVALCAGGPSLKDHLADIRRLQLEGAEVVAVGNVAHTLRASQIKVNGHIIVDGMERNRSFVVDDRDTRYFVGSQCDPSVLKALADHKHVYIWHAGLVADEKADLDRVYGRYNWFMILGGSFVTLRAISLLYILGYKWIHVFGFDSCLREDEHHAYAQPNADGQDTRTVTLGDRQFKAAFWMLDQADQFLDSIKNGRFGEAQLAIHGDGLIAYMINTGSLPQWQLRTPHSSFSTASSENLAKAL